jgi:hypothetical protein
MEDSLLVSAIKTDVFKFTKSRVFVQKQNLSVDIEPELDLNQAMSSLQISQKVDMSKPFNQAVVSSSETISISAKTGLVGGLGA